VFTAAERKEAERRRRKRQGERYKIRKGERNSRKKIKTERIQVDTFL
jgi:hypothetical protein